MRELLRYDLKRIEKKEVKDSCFAIIIFIGSFLLSSTIFDGIINFEVLLNCMVIFGLGLITINNIANDRESKISEIFISTGKARKRYYNYLYLKVIILNVFGFIGCFLFQSIFKMNFEMQNLLIIVLTNIGLMSVEVAFASLVKIKHIKSITALHFGIFIAVHGMIGMDGGIGKVENEALIAGIIFVAVVFVIAYIIGRYLFERSDF